MKAPAGSVLLFHTAANPSRAARVHAPGCHMVRIARARHGFGVVKLIEGEALQDTIDDLNEREFPVKGCKCLR